MIASPAAGRMGVSPAIAHRWPPSCRGGFPTSRAGDQASDVVETVHADDLDAGDEPGLGQVRARQTDAPVSSLAQGRDHGQHAGHRPDAAVEGQLPQQGPGATRGAQLTAGEQDADGDGDVVGGPMLAPVGRRQVHRDATQRIVEAGVADGAADPFSRL